MSFRTDGFEPSAYTIPPPRPRVMINTGAAHRGPEHSATARASPVDPLRPPPHVHLTRVSP